MGQVAWSAGGRRPAREIATRELEGSEWSISRPALALPPPTGTATRPRRCPSISHVIPLRLVQTLNVRRWNCNVFGASRKMTTINYVRLLVSAVPAAAFGCWGRTLRPFRRSSSQRWRGFCSIRSWLSACRRRVAPLMTPFPPFGGGEIGVWGGVAPKVQTASAKNAENGRLWWSAFWAQQCLAGGACSQVKPLWRTSTRYLECGWGVDARKSALLGLVWV